MRKTKEGGDGGQGTGDRGRRRAAPRSLVLFTCLLSLVPCLLSGCVHRKLTIITDPPGAQVYVNDKLKGATPVSYDFLWYGWHRVILRKDGYERLEDRRRLRAPVYLWIPFDFLVELLPLPVRDERTWTYTLTPTATPAAPSAPALLGPSGLAPGAASTGATHADAR